MSLFEQHILPLFEANRTEWLARARAVAFRLGASGAPVSIDDVRRICPPPSNVDPRVMGAVFTRKHWRRVGYLNSARATCHQRPIAMFERRNG